MDKTYFLTQSTALSLVIVICLIFLSFGIYYSKNYQGLKNYLTANRNIGFLSLTTSLTASALGAWILFGPASAATWGGLGAVIGYSLGTAFPMFFFIYLGKKIRKEFPQGSTLIEFLRKKFGKSLFKLILLMTIFYMFIFLCAEVTAVAVLINYISGTELWFTALIVLLCTLTYSLYGGLKASILTDNIQMFVIGSLLLISLIYILSFTGSKFSFDFVKEKNPHLLSGSYLPGYTSGLTFFIAVAATNLFHQGNWQRIYAAKDYKTLKKSLILSFLIIVPIVFFMGFTGLVGFSLNSSIRPDLSFFYLLLNEQAMFLSIVTFEFKKKTNYLNFSKYIIVFLSIISFVIASYGFDILYLFLLADLFCCAFVITVFYSFYDKIDEKTAYISIIIGLIAGFLFFPSPDFSKSLLVGILISKEIFSPFISQSLLFLSFIIATFLPFLVLKAKKMKF